MQTVKLETSTRPESGKGHARRLRQAGRIPAVLYGKGIATQSLSVEPKELEHAWAGELGQNVVLHLQIDGKEQAVQAVDYQVHPVTRALLHVDFQAVSESEPVLVQVPLEFVGKPKGLVMGGTLRKVYRKVPVKCLPSQIPARLAHDVSSLEIEDSVSVADLALPEGVSVSLPPNQRLGGVYGSRRRAGGAEDEETPDKK